MWSGKATEHYAGEISNRPRKLLLRKVWHTKGLITLPKASKATVRACAIVLLMGPMNMMYFGCGRALHRMTFDLCHAPLTITLAHPNPSLSVNELEDPDAILCSVWLEGIDVLGYIVIVWRWCCFTHSGSW